MGRIASIVAVMLWIVLGAACATSGDRAGQTTPELALAALPGPANVAHAPSATGGQHCDGAAYNTGFCGNVAPVGSGAEFMPNWEPGGDIESLAYALYEFNIVQGHASAELQLHWQTAPADYYIGLGSNVRQAWEWHKLPDEEPLSLTLAPYRFEGTRVLVCVVVLGATEAQLDALDLETPGGGELRKLFFLHHSTGWGIVSEGNVRGEVADYNSAHATSFEFWDQGYNGDGVRDQDGNYYSTQYPVPNDNTDPDGLNYLWASSEADAVACREGLMASYDVIAFKSCFPASGIYDDARLEQYKTWYTEMLPTFDAHPDKLFVVMSTPPLVPSQTTLEDAARARQFANWFKNSSYLTGHPNVVYFDLFDLLASAPGSGPESNMLRAEYRNTEDPNDSHPNATANAAVGPVFAQFLIDAALAHTPPG